ncbi:GNAT family N-acetyltransferase [uncultured Cloacibacillus sp.]|uniref:GNAT family N-acetyltransferase n=1 Tax=uncultured Cloacibacillus sp. TaxID=889794 RepID=UPI0025EFFED4|nr:GNAT family N-acetyltransferase [uncultured Cloacibacillus sp.]
MPAAEQGVIHIRAASPDDAAELLEIYAPYVRETAISFEYEVPALEEFRARITATLARYPYLAAERGGALLGYAYCGAFSGRAAYALSAETSIYVRRGEHGLGIGRRLYETLFAAAKAQNLRNLYADAAYPDAEDEYLTFGSIRFHERMGYRIAGKFRNCGCKFGRWYSVARLEKIIGAHEPAPAPFVPFPELGAETLRKIGIE